MMNHSKEITIQIDYFYRTLMTGGSGSGKTNVFLNLIKH